MTTLVNRRLALRVTVKRFFRMESLGGYGRAYIERHEEKVKSVRRIDLQRRITGLENARSNAMFDEWYSARHGMAPASDYKWDAKMERKLLAARAMLAAL